MNPNPFNIKAVVIDNDGTLKNPKGQPVDLSMLSRIEQYCRLADEEIVPGLVIATGRNKSYLEPTLQELGIQTSERLPHIIENGAALLYATPNGESVVPHPDSLVYVSMKRELESLLRERVKSVDWYMDHEKTFMTTLYPSNPADIHRLLTEVRGVCETHFLRYPAISISWSSSAVDIAARGIHKGTGLGFFSQKTGIPIDRILVIGDSDNDVPMLSKASFVACPANATKEVKEVVSAHCGEVGCVGYIAQAPTTAGVAEILERFFDVELQDTRMVSLGTLQTLREKRDMLVCSIPKNRVYLHKQDKLLHVSIPDNPRVAVTREQIKALSDPANGARVRWAAGGLAIVLNTKDGKFLVSFYRDAGAMSYPDTLTIATGISASEKEFLNPERTMFREGLEELLIGFGDERIIAPWSNHIGNIIDLNQLVKNNVSLAKNFWPHCHGFTWASADVLTTDDDINVTIDWLGKRHIFKALMCEHAETNGLDLMKVIRWDLNFHIDELQFADGEETPSGSMLDRKIYLIPIESVRAWSLQKSPLSAAFTYQGGKRLENEDIGSIEPIPFMQTAMHAIARMAR